MAAMPFRMTVNPTGAPADRVIWRPHYEGVALDQRKWLWRAGSGAQHELAGSQFRTIEETHFGCAISAEPTWKETRALCRMGASQSGDRRKVCVRGGGRA